MIVSLMDFKEEETQEIKRNLPGFSIVSLDLSWFEGEWTLAKGDAFNILADSDVIVFNYAPESEFLLGLHPGKTGVLNIPERLAVFSCVNNVVELDDIASVIEYIRDVKELDS